MGDKPGGPGQITELFAAGAFLGVPLFVMMAFLIIYALDRLSGGPFVPRPEKGSAHIYKDVKTNEVVIVTPDTPRIPVKNIVPMKLVPAGKSFRSRLSIYDNTTCILFDPLTINKTIRVVFEGRAYQLYLSITDTVIDGDKFVKSSFVRDVHREVCDKTESYRGEGFPVVDPRTITEKIPILTEFLADGVEITLEVKNVVCVDNLRDRVAENKARRAELVRDLPLTNADTIEKVNAIDYDVARDEKTIRKIERYNAGRIPFGKVKAYIQK